MKVRTLFFYVFLGIGSLALAASAFADVVKEVGPDGTLTLESGRKIILAGVELDVEGVSVLKVLAKNQDLRVQKVDLSAAGSEEYAYAYMTAKSLNFPFAPDELAGQEEVMLNEFLLQTGAAKVKEGQDFLQKTRFLKLQEQAKEKGEGVWSYVY